MSLITRQNTARTFCVSLHDSLILSSKQKWRLFGGICKFRSKISVEITALERRNKSDSQLEERMVITTS